MDFVDLSKKWWVWFSLAVMAIGSIVATVIIATSNEPGRSNNQTVDDKVVLNFVSGTEYNIGEAGQVIAEVRDRTGGNAASGCLLSIWYPDKTLFLSAMGNLSTADNYFTEFTVPNVTGVYEYQANCTTVFNSTVVASKSFHVSEFQNETWTTLHRIKAVIVK